MKSVLKNLAKFTGKHLCWSLFFKMKKRLQHRCFAVNFAKFLRTPFLQNTSGRLHLIMRPLFFIQFVTCGTRTVWSIHFDQHFGTRLNPLFDQVFGNLVCIYRIILCLSSFAVI